MNEYIGKMSQEDQDAVRDILREFAEMQTWRNVTASHWEEVAQLILPTYRNTFFYGNYNTPGQKKTDKQIDSTGQMALSRFSAIMDSLLTPRNQEWHALQSNDYVMKDRASRLWFEQATKILFKYRYAPQGNFASQNQNLYQSLGAFGTGAMWVDEFDGPERGPRYHAIPLGEWFMKENHQGIVNGAIRWFRLTAEQANRKWPGGLPSVLQTALERKSQTLYNFLHRIEERKDRDPRRLDAKGKRFSSHYVSIEGQCLMQPESGYRCFPVACSRYDQAPGEVYGRSPAMMVLPALKTLNAQKRVFLKTGHRAADPVLLTHDDGLVNVDLRPGALNPGGMNADGKPLIGVLPTGQVQITKEQMEMEHQLIQDAFLVSLFQILTETPQMTATEVIERTTEKGILVAPTAGRQQSEYLGPLIDREIDILTYQRLLPPMPPRLQEAQGEYHVQYTSPLAKAAQAQKAAGLMRTVEYAKELIAVTQDASLLDGINMDKGIKMLADIQGVPESIMATDDEIQQKRKGRAQAQQRQEEIQAAPAKAALQKAAAAQAKAGMNQDQQQGAPQ